MGYHEINIPPSFAAWPSGQVYLEAEAVVDGQSANSATLLDGAIRATVNGRSGPAPRLRHPARRRPDRHPPGTGTAPLDIGVTLNSQDLSFSGVSKVYAYGYGADDLIWAAYGVNVPMNVYAGASADILDDNTAADTLVGGPGSWISDSAGTNDSSYTTSGSNFRCPGNRFEQRRHDQRCRRSGQNGAGMQRLRQRNRLAAGQRQHNGRQRHLRRAVGSAELWRRRHDHRSFRRRGKPGSSPAARLEWTTTALRPRST